MKDSGILKGSDQIDTSTAAIGRFAGERDIDGEISLRLEMICSERDAAEKRSDFLRYRAEQLIRWLKKSHEKRRECEAKLDAAMKALHSLTPGGSEFAGDIKRCVEYARDHRREQHQLIVKFKMERDAALERAEVAEKQLAYLADQHKRIVNEPCPTDEKHCACVPALKGEIEKLRAELSFANRERERIEREYHELIMAVGRKYPGETRHQTALRYIGEAENRCSGPCKTALAGEGK